MTLPLSYSRLRVSRALFRSRSGGHARRFFSGQPHRLASRSSLVVVRAKDGGEGRTRTFEAARATDLQSAAFDRFATSPIVVCVECKLGAYPAEKLSNGAGGRIRTPDLLITNQLLYQTELRQPRQKVNFSTSRATLQVPAGTGSTANGRAAGSAAAGATTSHCTHFVRRWRTASKRAIPAATDTFKL